VGMKIWSRFGNPNGTDLEPGRRQEVGPYTGVETRLWRRDPSVTRLWRGVETRLWPLFCFFPFFIRCWDRRGAHGRR